MKSKKMKLAVAIVFSVAMGFAATASAVRVNWGCMKACLGHGYGESVCTVFCED